MSNPNLTASPRAAALTALAQLPPPAPVTSVTYLSQGRVLVLGEGARAEDAALTLCQAWEGGEGLNVTWLASQSARSLAGVQVLQGTVVTLTGYLGKFELVWQSPIGVPLPAEFDTVLDLRGEAHFRQHAKPQGYVHVADAAPLDEAVALLRDLVGEFEKPKFFSYRANICAHSRSEKIGCNKCVDVCSAAAVQSSGDTVSVTPQLCVGCGACATVCPSGAMSYQYPLPTERGDQFKAMIQAYRAAAGVAAPAPTLLIHNLADGAALVSEAMDALPQHVVPFAVWHVASVGMDGWLAALAYGAGRVVMLSAGSEAPQYAQAIGLEVAQADAICQALGQGVGRVAWIEAHSPLSLCTQLVEAGKAVGAPASFAASKDKRTTIEFAVEHFARQMPVPPREVALPPGAMFGAVAVNRDTCTMCLACAGACPESALMDTPDAPRLRFIERNCVQCGLCVATCPENAISLVPRLNLAPSNKEAITLNESEPFLCTRCSKPFGTKHVIEAMLGRLTTHSMFASGPGLKRLTMCADCRVIDLYSDGGTEASILKL